LAERKLGIVCPAKNFNQIRVLVGDLKFKYEEISRCRTSDHKLID